MNKNNKVMNATIPLCDNSRCKLDRFLDQQTIGRLQNELDAAYNLITSYEKIIKKYETLCLGINNVVEETSEDTDEST
jgi:hypothetical protein